MGRTQSREQAFILTFEKLFNPEKTADEILSLAEESELFEPDDFTKELFVLTQENSDRADEEIKKYLKGWSIDRLPRVSVAILRLAVCEILFSDGVPSSVAVNEAVNLAKKYACAQDASFINGVLGSVIRNREQ